MVLSNALSLFVGKKRFLNRKFRILHPKTASYKITNDFSLFLDPKDLAGPSFYVMYGGAAAFYHYEESLKSEILQHLKSDGEFIDVGANIGLISLFISKFFPASKIYSFEPGDVTHECLANSIKKNKITNIELIKKGVSNQVANNISFFIDPYSTGGSSLVIDKDKHSSLRPVEKISLVTLDSFVMERGLRPSLIKVDVEDAEELVLLGARATINSFHPTFIVESNNEKILKDPSFMLEIFKDYQVREVGGKGYENIDQLTKLAKKNFDRHRVFTDYLFVKNLG